MNKQNLIIYDFIELFSILNEIKNGLNFNLLNVSKKGFTDLKLDHLNSFLIITKNKVPNLENQIVLNNYPLKISKLVCFECVDCLELFFLRLLVILIKYISEAI